MPVLAIESRNMLTNFPHPMNATFIGFSLDCSFVFKNIYSRYTIFL